MTISAASLWPRRCGTRNRASDSGSATVADSPIARSLRREPPQPRQPERQQVAALGGDQRMQLVEHDALQRREQKRRVVGRQQQRQLLRRGEQDVRRIAPLPLPPRHRRVAGAGLDLDRQTPSRRSALPDCARYRPRAPSAARYRGCGGRGCVCTPRPAEMTRGERSRAARARSTPPGSAEIRRASCRRRSGAIATAPSLSPQRPRLDKQRSAAAPPASAGIRPASCRRRCGAISSAGSDRRAAFAEQLQTDARGATSRAPANQRRNVSGNSIGRRLRARVRRCSRHR